MRLRKRIHNYSFLSLVLPIFNGGLKGMRASGSQLLDFLPALQAGQRFLIFSSRLFWKSYIALKISYLAA